jgi:hypothetical protein
MWFAPTIPTLNEIPGSPSRNSIPKFGIPMSQTMDELLELSAVDLAHAIVARQISSVELVTSCVKQIEAVNPRLNAIVQMVDNALIEVRRLDCRIELSKIVPSHSETALSVLHH